MKKLLITILCLGIAYGLYLNAYTVLRGDVHFFNDVARDFLLLRELDEKKIVLIGPRTNNNGLFHGPLWTYINYPAFLLSNGNPVGVSWFWMALFALFLITSFLISQHLLSTIPALVYVLLLTMRFTTTTNGIFHSLATFLFIPGLLYTIYQYGRTGRLRFLLFLLALCAAITQLNIGVGGSILILTGIMALGIIIQKRRWMHILAFAVIPLLLSNFIIFDIRHGFRMLATARTIASVTAPFIPFNDWISDRMNHTISLELLTGSAMYPFFIVQMTFVLLVVISVLVMIRNKKKRWLYAVFFYYYFGYMLLSFENKGIILGHFVIPLIPITALWLASFLDTSFRWVFVPLIGINIFSNTITSNQYKLYLDTTFMNKSEFSWLSLSKAAKVVADEVKEDEFGYFVFMPDSFAYQPRYAALWVFQTEKSHAYEYVKKPITYVIAAPPPPGDPYMNETWWIANQVFIKTPPVSVQPLPSGYKIYRYELSDAEQKIPHDKNIELGISFR